MPYSSVRDIEVTDMKIPVIWNGPSNYSCMIQLFTTCNVQQSLLELQKIKSSRKENRLLLVAIDPTDLRR